MEKDNQPILSVNNLKVSFKTDEGLVHAVRGVSFDLYQGETLCIVGESGSGKSVTSKTIMGILSANAVIEDGSVIYEGEDLTKVDESEFHRIRGHKIGMVFQDPLSSLNPIMKVGKQITEAMLVNSDLMKRKYDSMISKEEAAYKSCLAKKKTEYMKAERMIENSDESFDKKINALQLQIKKADFKASTVNPCEKEMTELEEEYENKILAASTADEKKQLKDEKNAKLQPYIEKMNEARKEATAEYVAIRDKNKAEIKTIRAEKKAAHKECLIKAKEIRKNADEAFKTDSPALKLALDEKKKSAKAEIKKFRAEKKAEYESDMATLKANGAIEEQLKERTRTYKETFRITKSQAKAEALKVMKEVGIPQPEVRFNQYPFEFSGGMRQRIVIAIALTANPEVLICDEPTTALDVTIQAQILELINRLKKERNMSVIFISHDLGVVANMADRVAVMYAGKIIEVGTASEVFYDPRHPYTWALLSSIPDLDSHEKLEAIPGTPPYLLNPPKGDAFAARNKYAMAIDFEKEPPFFKITDTHYAATWLLDKRAPKAEKPRIVSQRIKASLEREGVKYE
jgi:oligopeptide transport system ATP-binding protein